MELGFAIARRIPVLAQRLPDDLTLRQYVKQVANPEEAVRLAEARHHPKHHNEGSILLSPEDAIEAAHRQLEELLQALRSAQLPRQADLLPEIKGRQEKLLQLLSSSLVSR
jgi:hypothetical protein